MAHPELPLKGHSKYQKKIKLLSMPVQMAVESSKGLTPGQMPQQLQMLPHVLAQQLARLQQQQPQQAAHQPQQAVQQGHQLQQPPDVLSVLSETTCVTWVAIGSLAESLGDLDKAYSLYESALRRAPMNPEALTRLANICRSRDQFMKAADFYEKALNVHQENGDTWGLLGHCYLMMDDLQRAYAAYQRALYYLENPNVPRLWHGIGILYDRYGSLEYAEEAFVRVLDLDPNFEKSNEIYFRLGIIYKHQAKYQSALECFRYILANPPLPLTQPDVWFQIGTVFEQQKNWSGAKEAYEKVLEVNPNHAKVLQQLGCLFSQSEASTQQQGQSAPMPFQQDLALALKYLLQSIEADPGDAHSWYYLGRVHMLRGDFSAAYEAFQQAVNRDSRNPTFWCSIGVLYYQISQYRDALDAYTRAIRLNPYISEVWYDLGTLYETCNNQISDALDAYRQAERLDPLNPHIKARLEQLIKYQQDGNTYPPQPPPVSQQPRLPQGMVLESTQPQTQTPLGQSAMQLQGAAQPLPLQNSGLPNPLPPHASAAVPQLQGSSQPPQALLQPGQQGSTAVPIAAPGSQHQIPVPAPVTAVHIAQAEVEQHKQAQPSVRPQIQQPPHPQVKHLQPLEHSASILSEVPPQLPSVVMATQEERPRISASDPMAEQLNRTAETGVSVAAPAVTVAPDQAHTVATAAPAIQMAPIVPKDNTIASSVLSEADATTKRVSNGQKHPLDEKTDSQSKRADLESGLVTTETPLEPSAATPEASANTSEESAKPIKSNGGPPVSNKDNGTEKVSVDLKTTTSKPTGGIVKSSLALSEPAVRDDDDDDDEEKLDANIEPPLRRVQEEEDYDEE